MSFSYLLAIVDSTAHYMWNVYKLAYMYDTGQLRVQFNTIILKIYLLKVHKKVLGWTVQLQNILAVKIKQTGRPKRVE